VLAGAADGVPVDTTGLVLITIGAALAGTAAFVGSRRPGVARA
jgi:hypothetical protein